MTSRGLTSFVHVSCRWSLWVGGFGVRKAKSGPVRVQGVAGRAGHSRFNLETYYCTIQLFVNSHFLVRSHTIVYNKEIRPSH
jgi:hypothetical protein